MPGVCRRVGLGAAVVHAASAVFPGTPRSPSLNCGGCCGPTAVDGRPSRRGSPALRVAIERRTAARPSPPQGHPERGTPRRARVWAALTAIWRENSGARRRQGRRRGGGGGRARGLRGRRGAAKTEAAGGPPQHQQQHDGGAWTRGRRRAGGHRPAQPTPASPRQTLYTHTRAEHARSTRPIETSGSAWRCGRVPGRPRVHRRGTLTRRTRARARGDGGHASGTPAPADARRRACGDTHGYYLLRSTDRATTMR